MKRVYLDYAATTPIKKEVLEAMLPYFKEDFGNPSSIHAFGRIARQGIDEGRKIIANFLNANENEIIFTGSATEASNLAILGLIKALSQKNPHIITTAMEHHATLHACQELAKEKSSEVTYIKPDKNGIVNVEEIKKAIRPETRLITMMYVNNEMGAIEPIREIGKMIEKENRTRKNKIYFHTDAVQAINYLPSDVKFLHVDMLSLSAHKIYGPKGTGALFVKKGTPIRPLIHGGAQELGLRSGTENVAGIVGLGKAIELIKNKSQKKIKKLKEYFIAKIQKEVPEVELNGGIESAPHIANLYFKYIEGESIVLSLDLEGVACSTGSACTSQSLEPSHVIMACFNDPMRAAGSVRFSLGEMTTKEELDSAVRKIKKVVARLRAISPYSKGNK